MKVIEYIRIIFKGFIVVFIIFPMSLIAQENFKNSQPEIAELYNISESYYSVNDEFINGCIYPLPNLKILGDPYFDIDQWNEGALFINGKTYSHFRLKYDLFLDEIIIKVKAEENIERLITVNKSQIDSFIINSLLFINSRNLIPDEKDFTYYEKICNGKLSVYKHYKKRFIELYTNISPSGKFSVQKSDTYLFDNKNLTNINKTKSFLKYFEKIDQKKIKKYFKANNINYKNISRSQLKELMGYCEILISN